MILTVFLGALIMLASKPEEEDIPSMDTLDIGRSDGIKSIPSYFSSGKEEEEEEDIPDMDTYEDTGNNLVGEITILYLTQG
jgi:ubiquitin-like-conjugating enzyme ATG3